MSMRSRPTGVPLTRRASVFLLSVLLAGCASSELGPGGSSAQSPSPETTPTSQLPTPIAGDPCETRAEVRDGFSCVRGREGLRWQARFRFQDQACNPADPALRSNKIRLPEPDQHESWIAAACVALEWLSNASAELPTLKILSKREIPKATREALQASARASLRLIWKYRGISEMDPALIVITSPAEHCELTRELQVSNEADRVESAVDCSDTRQFSCDSLQQSGFAVMWDARNSLDRRLAGYKSSACSKLSDLGLSHHKFWQGVGASLSLDPEVSTAFATALVNPDYLISELTYILWNAETEGTAANLCGPGADYYVCQDWFRGSLTTYVSSSEWWKGQVPEHELSIWSQQYNYARQAAMEWFIAHFGLDAAFGLAQALVGVSSESEYLAVLDSYTDLTHEQLFAAIDAWVAPKFGLTPP